MSSVQDQAAPALPHSNVETVVNQLLFNALDADGRGLAHFFLVLLSRAEDLQSIYNVSAESTRAMLAGDEPIEQDTLNAQVLHTLYESRCLKAFLASACRSLAARLVEEIRQKQARLPRVKSVIYGSSGEVESFQVETPPMADVAKS